MLVDTHCHLDFPEYDADREEVISRARAEGIDYIVNVSSDLESARKSLALAQKHDFIYSAIGLHPHDAADFDREAFDILRELSAQEKVVAIGETGLDFYYDKPAPAKQEVLFRGLIDLANERGLPLVIHCRQAQELVLKIVREKGVSKAVVHCFSGDEAFLKNCLDLGFYVSFTANLTYKKSDKLKELVRSAPDERLMLETDAPFLAPQVFRGKRNEPAYVKYVAEEVARIKGLSFEEVCAITTQNAKTFFRLK